MPTPNKYDRPMQMTSVMLPEHLRRFAEELGREVGEGMADGIRAALEREMERKEKNVKKG